MNRHLLLDGDVLAYIAAVGAQGIFVDDAGWHFPCAQEAQGEAILDNHIFALKRDLGASLVSVYLSDPDDNWRMQVDPSYKGVRVDLVRPLLLSHLKQYLRERYSANHWEGLEADDVLGILATGPQDTSHEVIIVGRDKDFGTIPGLHHQIGKDKPGHVRRVSQWEADRFFMIQTLAGDRVDGYDGCPGIGMERAAQIVDAPMRLVPSEGVITRGKNKGDSVTRWMSEPTQDYWTCIVSHYKKAGMGEEDALRTARLARILRHGEYNGEAQAVTLWTPAMLKEVGQR